jgi:hypothetical protein
MRRGLAEVFSSAEEGAASTAKEIGDRKHSSAAVRNEVLIRELG